MLFHLLLERRVPLFEFVVRTCLADLDLDTAEGRVHGREAFSTGNISDICFI